MIVTSPKSRRSGRKAAEAGRRRGTEFGLRPAAAALFQPCIRRSIAKGPVTGAVAAATTIGVVWAQQQTPPQAVPAPAGSPVEIRPGQSVRPGEGREPEWPAPRITEYKPKSTLVVPAASAAAREVSGHRHPQPPADADLGGRLRSRGGGDGEEQPPPARQPERRHGRPAEGRARGHSHEQVSGPHGALRQRRLSRRRSGFRRQGGGAARAGHQGRRQGAEDLQGPRPAHSPDRRQPAEARRSRARSDLGGLRPVERAGPHPHGGAAGVLRADQLPERTLAGARALLESPLPDGPGARASKS